MPNGNTNGSKPIEPFQNVMGCINEFHPWMSVLSGLSVSTVLASQGVVHCRNTGERFVSVLLGETTGDCVIR